MKIINVTPGLLSIPPNGWGATEKIIWEYHTSYLNKGLDSKILYLDDVIYDDDTIVHIHVANLALIAKERGIPYYFTCHDHHAYLYGKNSECFRQNYEAIKHSIKSFVPCKYLVNYFNLPNLQYLSHGVNSEFFKPSETSRNDHKLLCVANNGFIHNQSEDRKGFGFAIESAKKLNLPITVAGPKNNQNFFDVNNFNYDKLTVLYDLKENELLDLYKNHTIFLHPSILEAGHPNLTLLEAMSCGLPVIGTFEENNQLMGMYKVFRDVDEIVKGINVVIENYTVFKKLSIESAKEKSWNNVVEELIKHFKFKKNMRDQLLEIYNNTQISYIDCINIKNNIDVTFNDGCKVEITGTDVKEYEIKFIDKSKNATVYETKIKNNMWANTHFKYFIDWKIEISELNSNKKIIHNMNLRDKYVKIVNESPSLGDYISWMPIVDLFQKKHNCVVDFYTPNKSLFEDEYKNINFLDYNHITDTQYYTTYKVGCFDPKLEDLAPKDYRTQNLQQICADILGIEFNNTKARVSVKNKTRKLEDRYVCISTSSTAGCKHWQNKTGWQQTVDYLNNLGYKVVVLQKEPLDYMDLTGLKNVIHPETETLEEAISWLYNCEFYIGLSSGISWLSWAIDKKVIMISGFTEKFNEFENPYRIINESVCHGCWNSTSYKFDGGDWNWCPLYKNTDKQFICSKEITFEVVKDSINKIILESL